jgi:hypothetical protein
MSAQLKITWNNASSTLIGNGDADDLIMVEADGTVQPEDKSRRTPGTRYFAISKAAVIRVEFNLKSHIDWGGKSFDDSILKIIQYFPYVSDPNFNWAYEVDGGKITGMHPQVSLPYALQSSGASTINMRITTDFVDITKRWMDCLQPEHLAIRKIWNQAPHFDTEFRVLACLSGFPKLWFASIPKACKNGSDTSAMVFFRPSGYAYNVVGDDLRSTFNEIHNSYLQDVNVGNQVQQKPYYTFFSIMRFLLSPVCDRTGMAPEPAAKTPPAGASLLDTCMLDHMPETKIILAGFEKALSNAGKPVVVLFPTVDLSAYGSPDYPEASANSFNLYNLAHNAVATLHGQGLVMQKQFTKLKRFGVGGFSFGGEPMWASLAAAKGAHIKGKIKNHIQEIFAFDVNQWSKYRTDSLIPIAAKQAGDLCLHVVPKDAIGSDISHFKAPVTAFVHPNLAKYPKFYDMKLQRKPGGNPGISRWYLHYVKRLFDSLSDYDWFIKPDGNGGMALDGGSKHQFSVFGGEDSNKGITFFQQFLEESKF